jgi:xanthine dehydrogenase YagS FAD-binding subunit
MKRFAYKNATTVAEAVSILRAEKAAVLAGGTDILNILKMGALTNPPETLVNIKNIHGLDFISEDAQGLTIGALTKLSDIAASSVVMEKYSALAKAAEAVASPPLREMGTIAGNLCQDMQCWYFRRSFLTGTFFDCFKKGGRTCFAIKGDNRYHSLFGGTRGCVAVNASDIAPVLIALNAKIKTTVRVMEAERFFIGEGHKTTTLSDDEIVTEIQIPAPKFGTKQTFTKFALRPTIDFAVVNVATAITLADGKVSDARIVLNAVALAPRRATGAEEALKGQAISESVAEAAASAIVKGMVLLADNKYKVQIAKTLVKRAVLA